MPDIPVILAACISIHALREEGDAHIVPHALSTVKFQSTPSVRRATLADWHSVYPRENFNPRPP